jgi:bacterioferritin-associated ferredoxin
MIICLCRGLTDRDIARAIAKGLRSPGAVFAAADCRPQCGSCVAMIRTMMAAAPAESDEPGYAAAAE